MMGKLRRLQGNLKVWNRDVFGDIRLRKKEILGRIEEIHCLELGGPLERSLRVEREDLKRVFVELIRKENVSWNRKAKIKWVKEGDCNTSFFHRVASCRKSKNHIGSLLLESGLEKLLFQDAFVLRIISPKCPKTEGFLDYDPG